MKICASCDIKKPFTEFHIDKASKDGFRFRCKACIKLYDQERSNKMAKLDRVYTAEDVKLCKHCREIKLISEFSRNLRNVDGKKSICKPCAIIEDKQRLINPEKQKQYAIDNPIRVCNVCMTEKPRSEFSNRADRVTGKSAICKSCSNLKGVKYHEAHKEERARYKAEAYNKDKDKYSARVKLYRKNNPGKTQAIQAANRAAIKRATPKWYEKAKVEQIYKSATELRAKGISVHVDHVIPLKGKLVCGLHCYDNLQILDAIENIKKGNKYTP